MIRATLTSPLIVLDVLLGVAIGLTTSVVVMKAVREERSEREKQRQIIDKVRDMIRLEDEE